MLLLTFHLGTERFAVPAADVREVVRAVAITPLPAAPGVVEGAVDVRGEIVPVLDLRQRLGMFAKPLTADEHLVIASAGTRRIAFRVDQADDLVEIDSQAVSASSAVSPTLRYTAGVVPHVDGTLVIPDLAGFLSAWETNALERALSDAAPEPGQS
jgi:purine-binding chemotaxis protein CheW